MRRSSCWSSLVVMAILALSLPHLGCARHHYYRVYDPYYTDYHIWNDDEIVYYRQWGRETHRDAVRDFRKLTPEEQKEYWTWRHNHPNHDRDKDHGSSH